jgi:hypothetical protein
MAAIQGNEVWNNNGVSEKFSTRKNAWSAYRLLCDYEAFLADHVTAGNITVHWDRMNAARK